MPALKAGCAAGCKEAAVAQVEPVGPALGIAAVPVAEAAGLAEVNKYKY
jgi:hypothetical protein